MAVEFTQSTITNPFSNEETLKKEEYYITDEYKCVNTWSFCCVVQYSLFIWSTFFFSVTKKNQKAQCGAQQIFFMIIVWYIPASSQHSGGTDKFIDT